MSRPWQTRDVKMATRALVYDRGWRGLWKHLVDLIAGNPPAELHLRLHTRGPVEIANAQLVPVAPGERSLHEAGRG